MYWTPHTPSKRKDADGQSMTNNFSSSNGAKTVSYQAALLLHDIHQSVVLADNNDFPDRMIVLINPSRQ